jgi:hypothetical protein
MAVTYDPSTSRGKVRQMLADTATESAQFTDAEVDAWLSDAVDLGLAAPKLLHYAAHLGWLVRMARQAMSAQSHSDANGRSVAYDSQSCERAAQLHLRLSGQEATAAMPKVSGVFVQETMDTGYEET